MSIICSLVTRFSRIAAIGALIVLAACAGDTIGSDAVFVENASPDGLAVIGLKSNKWYGWTYKVTWRRIDPATKEVAEGDGDTITIIRNGMEVYTPDGLNTPKHFVFRAKPGTYALYSQEVEAGNVRRIHTFRPSTFGFSIAAGEILYLGEFTFVVPEQGWAKSPAGTLIRLTGRDDAAARAALAEYPHVKGEPRFAALTPIKFN